MSNLSLDLHIHSRFAYRCSSRITVQTLLDRQKEVGLDLVGTGDILHPEWLAEIQNNLTQLNKNFILTTEVSIRGNIHILLLFETISQVMDTYAYFKNFSKDIDKNGRPHLQLSLEDLLKYRDFTKNYLVGLAHAFSYAGYFVTAKELVIPDVDFIELGLDFAQGWFEKLKTLTTVPFIRASDAHSLQNIGRQYITLPLEKPFTLDNFKLALTKVKYVSGIPTIGRWYADGKKPGVKSVVERLLSVKLEHTHESSRLPLIQAIAYKLKKRPESTRVQTEFKNLLLKNTEIKILESTDWQKWSKPRVEQVNIYGGGGISGSFK